MNIYEFMSLFSFSFIVFMIIGIFVLGFVASRKKKKAIKKINESVPKLEDIEDFINNLRDGGFNNEIKEDNQTI